MGRKTKRRNGGDLGIGNSYSMVLQATPCLQPALLCVWLSDCARYVLWRHGDPQSRSVTFQDVGPVVPLLTVCLSLVSDFLKETMVSGLFCTPRARCQQADHPGISQGQD